ncbi:Hint domain-containing protein [Shimia ponticola]|uniref:Hint domain-containing protein n=1 Tax=Shimia ponticola TaxID=2582893 RepID=UPI0011BE2451|nr:Hint domain-containing protein [Shimia ponticola]
MPDGYLVQLGDGSLDTGDSIVDPLTTFVTDTNLGAGDWIWSGTFGGQTYTNTQEPGVYYLATNGNVYFVPDFGPVTTITSSTALNPPAYSEFNIFIGTSDEDPTLDGTDDVDNIFGLDEDDVIDGAGDDDLLVGGGGSDTITGGSGDDIIYGDFETTPAETSEVLSWETQGADETNVVGGLTQDTGNMNVSVAFTDDGALSEVSLENNTSMYREDGEPFDVTSALYLRGDGSSSETLTATFTFNAEAGTEYADDVQDVSFRINDIDTSSFIDTITITAFDEAGNAVPVSIVAENPATITVTGQSITATGPNVSPLSADGSVLVTIAGPVHTINIDYGNGGSAVQAVFVSDIAFTTIVPDAGDDVIDGGTGADTMYGGDGDDIIYVGDGDDAFGQDGDDTFILTDYGEANSAITIEGGEGGETNGDTLMLNRLASYDDIIFTNTDDANGGLSGSVTLFDGTLLTFSNIETIICFAEGSLIDTPYGPRPIQDLRVGDLVLTRDAGPQPIRWLGHRTVPGLGNMTPVRLTSLAGQRATTPLTVSPQHRMLIRGPRAELLFGEREVLVAAKHLIDGRSVTWAACESVTYYHMMLDTHQVVTAHGLPSESFFAGQQGLSALDPAARHELFTLFPELRSASLGRTARRTLSAYEAAVL